MVSQLIVGENTYVTVAEADTYLADSLRGSPWLGVAPDDKKRALITAFRLFEKQRWQGTQTGVQIVATAVIAAGGTAYTLNDILTIGGGTFGQAARVQATAVSGGIISAVTLIDAGTYDASDTPTSPAAVTGGTGADDATITLTFKAQEALQPRTGLTDCDGVAIDVNTVAQQIEDAQVELAFELTRDATLETKQNQGSNIKGVGAGSARVDFFRATNKLGEAGRFPAIVQELIKCFTGAGTQLNSGSIASGSTPTSQFDDCDTLDLNSGQSFP